MKITLDNTLQPSENVTWRDVDNEIVVLKLDNGEYFTFNALGHELWLDIAAGKSINEIIDKITQEFEVEKEQAEQDVKKFISGLLEKDLITITKH